LPSYRPALLNVLLRALWLVLLFFVSEYRTRQYRRRYPASSSSGDQSYSYIL
jgi:hypothetical protein